MPARLFPALQARIIKLLEQEQLTGEEVVVLTLGTAVGRLKAMPQAEARALALQVIEALHKHVLERPTGEAH